MLPAKRAARYDDSSAQHCGISNAVDESLDVVAVPISRLIRILC